MKTFFDPNFSAGTWLLNRGQQITDCPTNLNEFIRDPNGAKTGSYSLMFAVLKDAVDTFMHHAHADSRRAKRLFKEAEDWFMSKDSSFLYSFENICMYLGLSPDNIRRGLEQWIHLGCKKSNKHIFNIKRHKTIY